MRNRQTQMSHSRLKLNGNEENRIKSFFFFYYFILYVFYSVQNWISLCRYIVTCEFDKSQCLFIHSSLFDGSLREKQFHFDTKNVTSNKIPLQ